MALEVLEQLLDRVQPRGVLWIVEQDGLHPQRQIHDATVVVDRGVVHEQHHLASSELRPLAYVDQQPVEEVLKDGGVHPAFDELVGDETFLRDSRQQAERVHLPPRWVLGPGQPLR